MSDVILHLAPAGRWRTWPAGTAYLPEAYEADGFVHCTAGDELMLAVANRFYGDGPGAFVALTIDPGQLTSELRWEASVDGLAPLFPHVYGPIDAAAVMAVRPVLRAPDGRFTGFGAAQ
ncbi:MAG: DUF952 domain-containing protein [Dehalococcoidia bacterium]|nr:DUF952 domain-containing protein [Dehalococcoidia bacterium]